MATITDVPTFDSGKSRRNRDLQSAPGVVSARHWISNLLHTYVDFAERKDVDGAVGLLASARVSFPGTGFDHPDDAEKFFAELWKSPVAHRHDVSNLVVLAGSGPRVWKAHAHYTRWVFEPILGAHPR